MKRNRLLGNGIKGAVLLSLVIFVFSFSVSPVIVNAASPENSSVTTGNAPPPENSSLTVGDSSKTFSISNPLKVNSISELVQTGAQIFSYVVVLIAVIALIWTGLQYILAQGNSERIKELKSQLLWIVIGIAIVIGARIIISVVINTLEATGTVDPAIINNARSASQIK